MKVPASTAEEVSKAARRIPDRMRIVCWILLAALVVLLFPLLLHRSTHAWLFGLYSKKYSLVILFYVTAIGLTASFLWRGREKFADTTRLVTSYGFWFWLCVWLILIVGAFLISLISGDTDFQNLGFAFIGFGICAWWLVFHLAGRLAGLLNGSAVAATATILTFIVVELVLALFPVLTRHVEIFRDQKLKLYEFERAEKEGREFYQSFLTPDPELGYRQKPNVVMIPARPTVGESGDPAAGEVRTDRWGFLNADLDPSQPYDVACVGDSFVVTGWTLLLREKTGLRLANFGVPSYAPPQYSIVLRRYALKLKPKVILYCLYMNDALESVAYEQWKKSGMDWFRFKGGLWFGPRTPHAGRLLVQECLLRYSRVYSLIDFLTLRETSELMPVKANPVPYKTDNFTLVFDRRSYTGVTNLESEAVRHGIQSIRASLEDAKRSCHDADTDLLVLLLPPKELVHYEGLKEVALEGDPIENLPNFHRALEEICEQLGLKCYDLTDRFREEVEKTGKAFYQEVDIHWNDDGVRLMAEIAAEVLADSGKVEIPRE